MGKAPRLWQLAIDESGSFEGDERSVVVGVLLQHDSPHALAQGLRRSLEELAPEVPWPLHATELRVPSSLLASWLRLLPAQQERSPLAPALARLAKRLSDSSDEDAQRFRDAIASAAKLRLPALQRGWAWIQHAAPSDAVLLEARSAALRSGVRAVLRQLPSQLGEGRVAVVAALAPATASKDRYLDALQTLFERLYCVLRSREGSLHEVRVEVARRHVEAHDVGQVALRVADVTRRVRLAERFPFLAPAPEKPTDELVRLVIDRVVDYRLSPSPAMVLADFASNAIGRLLRSWDLEWPALGSALRRDAGIPLELVPAAGPAERPVSTLAQPDPWRAALRALLEGRPALPLPLRPRWCGQLHARDTAWLESLRGALP